MATETAVDVVMPQMGVSVSEGTITRWLKQEGEHVESDEPLLEISTDKVDTEVPSPASGTLTQILVQEGETVDVGTKLAQIGGAVGAAPQVEQAPPAPATQEAAQAADAASPAETPQPVQPIQAAPEPVAHENGNRFVSPVVARIASEHGVDPGAVPGTGRGGRVTKQDIMGYIEQGGTPQQEQAAPAAPAPAPAAPTPPAAPAPHPAPARPTPPACPCPAGGSPAPRPAGTRRPRRRAAGRAARACERDAPR